MLKRLLIPTLILAVAVPVIAQRQRPVKQRIQQRLQMRGVRQAAKGLRGLELTEDQRNQLKALRESNKAQREAITQDVRQKRQALQSLKAQDKPDATQLGNAMLALKEAQGRGRQLRQQTLDNWKRSLTADQQRRLEEFQSRRKNPRRP